MYVSDKFVVSVIPNKVNFEELSLILRQKDSASKKNLFVTVYNNKGATENFLTEFDSFVKVLPSKDMPVIICGDFNIHLESTSKNSEKFMDHYERV